MGDYSLTFYTLANSLQLQLEILSRLGNTEGYTFNLSLINFRGGPRHYLAKFSRVFYMIIEREILFLEMLSQEDVIGLLMAILPTMR